MPILTREQIIEEIKRFGDGTQAHSDATLAKWKLIDEYYRNESKIELPEAVKGETGDLASLVRLLAHTNYCKTIVNSSVTMAMASGVKVVDSTGKEDKEAARVYRQTDIRRLLRYASRYGAGWMQLLPDRQDKPYRIYKPHVARRVMMDEDPELERAVLVIHAFERRTEHRLDEMYHVARWYEWNDERTRVSRTDFISENRGATWTPRPLKEGDQRTFPYMPWVYVPNKEEDTIPEQSDVLDGLELFKQYDALRVKFLKALEDESFRQIFLSNVSSEQAQALIAAGGLNVWFAKNKQGEDAPEMQSVPPADQRQMIDALKDLVESMSTTTRTCALELSKPPVQDIPAQTLRVLYGPQIERVRETTEHLNPALSQALSIIRGGEYTVSLVPRLPISEDKDHQNKKGLLDSNAYSARQLLVDMGYTEAEADAIFRQRLEERRLTLELETEAEVVVAEASARAAAANRPAGASGA